MADLSVDFDTASVSWGDLASVPDSDVDFTIECWVKLATNSGYISPFAKGSLTGWYLTNDNSTTWGVYFDDARLAVTGQTISIGTWQYICLVHTASANTVQGYYGTIGGGLTTGTLTSSIAGPTTTTDPVLIGKNSWGSYIDGAIRIARVWDQALSSSEISAIWDQSLPAGYDANLVFNWDGARDPGSGVAASDFKDLAGDNLASSVETVLTRSTDDPPLIMYGAVSAATPAGMLTHSFRSRKYF